MKKSTLFLVSSLLIILLLASCNGKNNFKNIREGEIYYKINYVTNPSSLPSDLLPKELIIIFRNDRLCTTLKAPVGNTGITTVINPGENIYDTYLNLFSFKYYFEGNAKDIQPGFSSMDGITLHETGKKEVICGFNCRQARVEFPNSNDIRYIWYTDEIKASNPNNMTPFKDINGVLMDFFYIIGNAELQFTADEVIAKEVSDKEFQKKKNYKKVSETYLDALILKMISL